MIRENVTSFKTIFLLYFVVTNNDKNLKAGEYLFKKDITFYEVVNSFKKSNLFYRKITIPECFTVHEILNLIKTNPFIIDDIKKLPSEGTLFPDTYYFLRNVKAESLITRMEKRMNKKLEKVRKKNYTYFKSKNDLLTMASLIEAEAKKNEDKYFISSVFHNRLKKNMRLQSDPTVLYKKNFMKEKKILEIYKKDLKDNNPWNTYIKKGLPITPICNPGIEAINAAANPNITDFLYFVSDGEGGHRFSKNLDEHHKNIKLWKNKK